MQFLCDHGLECELIRLLQGVNSVSDLIYGTYAPVGDCGGEVGEPRYLHLRLEYYTIRSTYN